MENQQRSLGQKASHWLSAHPGGRLLLAMLFPFIGAAIQWKLRAHFPTTLWIFIYPAIFCSAWVGRLTGGIIGTIIGVTLALYIFAPPNLSWVLYDHRYYNSALVFSCMGLLFSLLHEQLHRKQCEIIQLKNANLDLTQASLNLSLDAANAGLWQWHLQSQKMEWSEQLWRLYDLPPNSIETNYEAWIATIHPDDVSEVKAKLELALKTQSILEIEWRLAHPHDHQERWLFARANPAYGKAGSLSHYRGITIDNTQRKQSEIALKNSEREFRLLAAATPQIIWRTTSDGWNTYFNQQWIDYTGLSLEQSYGEGWITAFHPDDQQKACATWLIALQNQQGFEFECRLRRADGEYRWWLLRGIPDLDERGNLAKWLGTATNIHGLKLSAEQIQTSEAYYRLIFSANPVPMYIVDYESLVFLDVNTAALLAYEYSREEFLGLSIKDIYPSEDTSDLLDCINNAFSQFDRPTTWGDCLQRKKQGTLFWMNVNVHALKLNNHPALIVQANDISERKSLTEKMQRWADAFEYCAHGIALSNPTTGCLNTCNPAFMKMLGYSSAEEMVGLPIMSLYAEASRDQAIIHLQKADQIGFNTYESVYQKKNGSIFDVLVDIVTVKDGLNNPLYRVATVQDISSRKRAEEKIVLQSQALEATANGIMITDANGVIEWVNPAFTQLTGYSSSESIGSQTNVLFKCDILEQPIAEQAWKTVSSGKTWHGERLIPRKNGSIYPEEQIITPVIDDQGVIRHYIAIKLDITERKQIEAELLQHREHLEKLVSKRTAELDAARAEAERLSTVKSDFLANMSHEIRSPMNAILGLCYLLKHRPMEKDAQLLVEKIYISSNSLLGIINDILDFSRIEAGRLVLETAPFNLSELLDHVAVIMSSIAQNKNLELIINPAPFIVNDLLGDSLRLQQILINLISNAIKFTESGEVALSVRLEAQYDQTVNLRFTVHDTGIGISPQQQKEIFSAFSQADTSIGRRFGGSGLGLTISQELVKLMGGTLEVNSVLGQGSEFWFVLPLHLDCSAVKSQSNLSGLELLVADDSATAREALVNSIESLGWKADAVDSGKAAEKQTLIRLQADKPYDVLILDWKMPEQNGLTTAQNVREAFITYDHNPEEATIVIMVSAYSREELLAQAGIASIDRVLSKPVTPSSLYNAVADVLHQRTLLRNPLPPDIPELNIPQLPGVRILIVDDSDINREVAQSILEAEGAIINTAEDGQVALEWLTAHPDAVDLILMDIQMPRMDGYEATRLIRRDQRWQKLPIVALTAGAFKSLEVLAKASGMNDFVSKPFDAEHLIALIKYLVYPTLEVFSESKSYGIFPIETVNPEPSLSTLRLPGIDIREGLNRWRRENSYRQYLSRFSAVYAHAGDEILEFIRQSNTIAASALAHKLKGVAGNLALTQVLTLSHDIDSILKSGKPVEDVAVSLQVAIDQVCDSIAQLTQINTTAPEPLLETSGSSTRAELLALLETLLISLDTDSLSTTEPLLLQLQGKLPVFELDKIQQALANFDFRAAESATRVIIAHIKEHFPHN